MPATDVAVLVGSLRQSSLNRQMARALAKLAPAGLVLSPVELGDLPLYNEDLEADPPAAWGRFRKNIADADALLFVTPENNRSIPAVLKNAVDIGSRPWGKSVWNGKTAAVISVSPGAVGAFGANHHLRQSLMSVNVAVMPHPEAYIGGASKVFDAAGELVNPATVALATEFMASFEVWIERLRPR
jgi:chromate reductase, NAD(P)H dehydrogenase (quinone)